MKGFIRVSLLVAVGAVGLAQGYRYEARGLSDIIAALEGGEKASAAPAVTKEITKTMTVTKSAQGAAAPTGAAIQAAGTGGQFSFLTSTVFASGAPPTVTVTPLPQMVTQTVTEQVMVTMMATQMSVVTSMVTMTMMQTTTVMVSVTMQGAATAASIRATVASVTTSAAIQAGGSPAPALGAAQIAQPNPVDINTFSLSSSLVLGNLAVATAV
ncbi:hypothetical protein BPAE_0004g01610 [Botrytis paeoniae]|uniref:Yeast cell wall synthesis Kre9/Knh1 C-terminal domain-containing protein n=1 Tax=Botrytis paeoniae TaxID=278948 RepID=A0A4Z1G129_9HELO|nr:hypothetical protein BPAE_0004g01610 [Botrytis paeoniae]